MSLAPSANGLRTGTGMEMLRLATAGSVDDGKSTLIGRLLYDSKSIFTDQLESIERTSAERGDEYANLALLTDGLRAEREQGITIDVAYRYFSTPRRKFIIADTPRTRAVHPQHGDRGVHGRPRHDPHRCAQGRTGTDPQACIPLVVAGNPAPDHLRQQDLSLIHI